MRGRCIKTPPADNASPAVGSSTDAWKREGTYEHQFKVEARIKLCRRIILNVEFHRNALSFTEGKIKVCTWLREISSCSCLTELPGPARVLLSKTNKPLLTPLYCIHRSSQPIETRLTGMTT